MTFWWKVSSEENHDYVSISVNGVEAASISGETDWRVQTVYLGVGPQTVRWTYAKDASGSEGKDGAWLDIILVTPGGTPPTLTSQPSSLSVQPGQNVTFSAGAFGTPPLAYQWTFEGANLSGATGSSLTVNNVQASNQGTYALVVTDPVRATNTVGALLELAQVVAWGVKFYGQTRVPFGLSNIIAVTGGYQHSMALRAGRENLCLGRKITVVKQTCPEPDKRCGDLLDAAGILGWPSNPMGWWRSGVLTTLDRRTFRRESPTWWP